MKHGTLRRRLAAHIAIRLVVATVLLGSAVVVQLREPGAWPVTALFVLSLLEPVVAAPALNGYQVRLRNEREIEVEVAKGQGRGGSGTPNASSSRATP